MAKHQFIKEDDKAFYMHDGKQPFIVAKRAVGGDVHEKIRALPKYAMGGMVEQGDLGEEEKASDKLTKKIESSPFSGAFSYGSNGIPQEYLDNFDKSVSEGKVSAQIADSVRKQQEVEAQNMRLRYAGAPADMLAQRTPTAEPIVDQPIVETQSAIGGPELPVEQQSVQQVQPAQQPNVVQSAYNQFQTGLNEQRAGIKAQADAESQMAQEQAKIYEGQALKQKHFEDQLVEQESQAKRIMSENDALSRDILENKVNPNRLWGNMSSGNKILSVISLILGGAGSGGNAANNAALNIMNKQIDDDIKAQMSDRENKQNLYNMNLKRYGNTQDAIQATRLQLNAAVNASIAASGARAQDKISQAKAKQLSGLVYDKAAKETLEFASKLGSQTFAASNPIAAKLQQLPKERQDEAYKELGLYQASEAATSRFKDLFNKSVELSTLDSKISEPFQNPQKRAALAAQLYPVARQIAGPGVFTDKEKESILDPMLSRLTSNKETNQFILGEFLETLRTMRAGQLPVLTAFQVIPNQQSQNKIGFVQRGK